MKAGFPTICGQRVRGDSMPIAASATCYDPKPCAPCRGSKTTPSATHCRERRKKTPAVLTIDLMKKGD
jgi:hypothetical protein